MLEGRRSRVLGGLDYKWQASIVVALGLFLAVLDNTIVSVALPDMRTTFSTDFSSITWVVTAYFLSQAAVIPVMGYLSDLRGTKFVFVGAMAIFVLGSLVCAISVTKEMLIVARVLQGIGGGALMPTSFAIAYRAFPREEWGRATTIIGAPVLLAPALGPIIGGYLTTTFDWRAIFTVNLPVGCLALVLAVLLLRARAADEALDGEGRPEKVSFDLFGFCLSVLGFTLVVYGLTEAGLGGWTSHQAVIGLLLGAAALCALTVVELRVVAPVLDIRLFLDTTFARASILLWTIVAIFYGSLFLLPFYFEQVQGHSPITAGQILLLQGVASAVGIALGGELYDAVGPRPLAIAGAGALAISMIGFTRLGVSTSGLSLQGWLVLRGVGLGLTTTPLQNLALSGISRRNMARASSLVNVVRQVFSAAGLAILTALATQQAVGHTDSLTRALRHASSGTTATCSGLSGQAVIVCVRQHATVLGLNDAFTVALGASIGAFVLALFVGRDATLNALKAVAPEQLTRVFPRLDRDAIIDTARRMQPVPVGAGETIVRQGDVSDRFYVLTKGEVRVTARDSTGDERELRTMQPGSFFGEIGLLQGVDRTATVTALVPSEVLVLDGSAFSDLVSRSPETAGDLNRIMWQRLAVVP